LNEDALIIGAALDYLDDPDHLALKLAFLTALSQGRIDPSVPLDPYDAIAPMIVALCNGVARREGKIEIPSWLTPRPAWRDRELVRAEKYREFMDGQGIAPFVEQCRRRAAAILPRVPVLISVDHALAAGAIRAASERYGPEAVAVVVLDAHFDAIPAKLRAAFAEEAPPPAATFAAAAADPVIFGSGDDALGLEDLPPEFNFESVSDTPPAPAAEPAAAEALSTDTIPPDLSFEGPEVEVRASAPANLLAKDSIPADLCYDSPPSAEPGPAQPGEGKIFCDDPLPDDLNFDAAPASSAPASAVPGPKAKDSLPPDALYTDPLELAEPLPPPLGAQAPPPGPPPSHAVYHAMATAPRVGMRPAFGSGPEGLCGDFLARLMDDGVLAPQNLFVAGVSDYPTAGHQVQPYGEAYLGWIERGVKVYLKKEALAASFGMRLATDLANTRARVLYVSLDADVAASASLAAVRFMDHIGLPEERVLAIAYALRDLIESERFFLAGLDLSETEVHFLGLSSPNAGADRTAWLCARFAAILLGNMTLK
jgi:arginase family enzyme